MTVHAGLHGDWRRFFSVLFSLTPASQIIVGGFVFAAFGIFSIYQLRYGVICVFPAALALGGMTFVIVGGLNLKGSKKGRKQESIVETHGEAYACEIASRGYSGKESIDFLRNKGLTELRARQAILKLARRISEN